MSQLRVLLQESLDRERETVTILALLREKMDGVDSIRRGGIRRRRSIKERLGLKSMSCCGATWGFRSNTVNLSDADDDDEEEEEQEEEEQRQQPQEQSREESSNSVQNLPDNEPGPVCVGRIPLVSGGMNLAAALAAERHIRAADGTNVVGPTTVGVGDDVGPDPVPGTLLKVSLMRLLAETEGCGGSWEEKAGEGGVGGSDSVCCCVCMERKKGAAFIPCGHTFCRVCSREIWLNRGSCPLCNRWIIEILDIY